LIERANDSGTSPREWACTILIAVCSSGSSAFLQIGDGAIVVKDKAGLRPVFWPQSGEYINQTVFVTSPDAMAHIALEAITGCPLGIAILSDGLQGLALDYKARSAHSPFFLPLFSALLASPTVDDFEGKLLALLNSASVNKRTDDDKTIVIAHRNV
jgi:hypothetical protein